MMTIFSLFNWNVRINQIQVNLCRKHLFLRHLTHNMTTDCSLNYEFGTMKLQENSILVLCSSLFMLCTKNVLNVKTENNMCGFLALNSIQWIICRHIQWVSWCKNKCFWQKFTYLYVSRGYLDILHFLQLLVYGATVDKFWHPSWVAD